MKIEWHKHLPYFAPSREAAEIFIVDINISIDLPAYCFVINLLGIISVDSIKLNTVLATVFDSFFKFLSGPESPENKSRPQFLKLFESLESEQLLLPYTGIVVIDYCTVKVDCNAYSFEIDHSDFLNYANLTNSVNQLKFIIILLPISAKLNISLMRNIPNLVTSLNLASGFIALIFAANGQLVAASWFILAAMIFDFFDGLTARLLKAYSDIGRELDSLADLVSFGVAPAFIIYKLIAGTLDGNSGTGIIQDTIGFVAFLPVVMPVCAALRLAIFNLDTTQKTSFKGLPTPANALAVITVVIAGGIDDIPVLKWFTGTAPALISYTLILSILMVTRLPMLSLKFSSLQLRGNESRYTLIGLVIISSIILGAAAAPLIIPVYILVSLGSAFISKV
jgi:CDP-diacylglycerol---serine O-phosphatidyltransferase